MHVALYVHSRIPVKGYGGTQRVVVWLARGLVQLGHQVTILALGGSRIPEAHVIPLTGKQFKGREFDITPLIPSSADILHAHSPLARTPKHPHVFTLHGNLRQGAAAAQNIIFLSADHARRHGSTTFVYNGVDPSDYVFRSRKNGYDLFLGRLHSVKGYRWAIQGARQSGKRLVVAGGWRPSWRRSLRYAGSVDGSRKAELLAGANCLWMPALWDEPFGLTLVEALMSGTPVLGTRRGALPEVISPEVGVLGNTLEELVRLRPHVDWMNSEACRKRAETCFSHLLMAERYIRMYWEYLTTSRLPAGQRIDGDEARVSRA
jgi:glycosyltransferase involved in cell wall biosynthesis